MYFECGKWWVEGRGREGKTCLTVKQDTPDTQWTSAPIRKEQTPISWQPRCEEEKEDGEDRRRMIWIGGEGERKRQEERGEHEQGQGGGEEK